MQFPRTLKEPAHGRRRTRAVLREHARADGIQLGRRDTGPDVGRWSQSGDRVLVWLKKATASTRLELTGWVPLTAAGGETHLDLPALHVVEADVHPGCFGKRVVDAQPAPRRVGTESQLEVRRHGRLRNRHGGERDQAGDHDRPPAKKRVLLVPGGT